MNHESLFAIRLLVSSGIAEFTRRNKLPTLEEGAIHVLGYAMFAVARSRSWNPDELRRACERAIEMAIGHLGEHDKSK